MIDLTRGIAGSLATMIFADYDAEVIRLEATSMKIVLNPGDTLEISLDEAFDDFVTISYGGEVKNCLTVRERTNLLYSLSTENPFGDGERDEDEIGLMNDNREAG